MGKRSRDKGKRGELELAAAFRAEGFDARRGQQHKGGSDSPDVMVDGLPWLYPECKRVETYSIRQLYDALALARREGGPEKLPAVFYRRNDHERLVVMGFEDFCKLAREYEP